jgi:predicted DNA-binding protein (MmcQ/YjbR family)
VCRNVQLYKRHWNTVIFDGTVADDEVQEWIEHSYDLVVAKLSRRRRDALGGR